MEAKENPFYRMIKHLFNNKELVLFGRIDQIKSGLELPVINLLQEKYNDESLGYPYNAPPFDKQSAYWSSKILFYTAQLVMYREHDASALTDIIKPFRFDMTPSAILTADLSLRFLPGLLKHLEQINIEDELIPLLRDLLNQWHYSGLLSDIEVNGQQFTEAYDNPCLRQLYVDRVITQKQNKIGHMIKIKSQVKSALGNYEHLFWKDYKTIT